ncbi:MAG: DNA gyrase inhibitor YacG [Pseudohongiella sp.]|nr:MAG: DNA gyrase inhibitor YacG [Pseudohongiella sp.]
MNSEIQSIECPTCKKLVEWRDENEHRPFCSNRCKLIDFGEWASERNSIPGEPVYPTVEDDYDQ